MSGLSIWKPHGTKLEEVKNGVASRKPTIKRSPKIIGIKKLCSTSLWNARKTVHKLFRRLATAVLVNIVIKIRRSFNFLEHTKCTIIKNVDHNQGTFTSEATSPQ